MIKLRKALWFRNVAMSWQLLVLAVTSVVLSIASGWTTWIGMRNFTDESVLSLMITFGIQGVMLVLAWFIGVRVTEHVFEATPTAESSDRARVWSSVYRAIELLVVVSLSLVCVFVVSSVVFENSLSISKSLDGKEYYELMAGALVVSVIIFLAINFSRLVLSGLLNTFQFMFRNIVPICMILICMFASVFFSFDALFSTILPAEERGRIAQLRSKSDVASIINEMRSATEVSRRRQIGALLASREWSDFDTGLKTVAAALRKVPDAIGSEVQSKQNRALGEASQRNKVLSDLAARKNTVQQHKSDLKQLLNKQKERAKLLHGEVTRLDQVVFEKDRQIVEKTAEIDAELKGIGVTERPGRGPEYRKLTGELVRLRETRANSDLRRSSYRDQVTQARAQIANYERAVAAVDGELEQLNNRIEQQRLKAASGPQLVTMTSVRTQSAERLAKLEFARLGFETNPTNSALSSLRSECVASVSYLSSLAAAAPSTSIAIDRSKCGTTATQSVAGRVFALNKASTDLQQKCIAAGTGAGSQTVEARLVFARNCLSLSALLPSESSSIIASINALERERDDKAHRFVVTYNAFSDGNKLAFLAASIAAAIDVLVLASGLLGAAAVRSPLAGRGLRQDLSATEREVIIETSLLPDVGASARYALAQFVPIAIAQRQNSRHWTHEFAMGLNGDESQIPVLRRLMNAGMVIDAVKADEDREDVFSISLSLVEFLAKLARNADAGDGVQQEFRRLLIKALGDQPAEQAEKILAYFVPSLRYDNYSSCVDLQSVDPEHAEVLRQCLNVASAFGFVAQGDSDGDGSDGDVLVSGGVYLALLRLSTEADEPRLRENAVHEQANVAIPAASRPAMVESADPVRPAVAAAATSSTELPISEPPSASVEDAAAVSATTNDPPIAADLVDRMHSPATSQRRDDVLGEPPEPRDDEADKLGSKPKQQPKILVGNDSFSFD